MRPEEEIIEVLEELERKIAEVRKKILELAARDFRGRPLFQPRYNLIGERFARLVVTGRAEDRYPGHGQWLCVCDCGTKKVIAQAALISGNTQSCGCLQRELSRERMRERYRQQKQRDGLHPE